MRKLFTPALAALAAGAFLIAPAPLALADSTYDSDPAPTLVSLREAASEKGIVIGTAVAGGGHHDTMPYENPFRTSQTYRSILAGEFSSVTPENQMKWDYLRPSRDEYNFTFADEIVAFAQANGQVVRGHTLLWHSQNPQWLENGEFSAEELRQILKEHITTVVGRYKGKIQQWDVANEIFTGAGQLRTEENIWIRELGPEIIADAFRWAHEADPDALLFFNDYSVDGINAKSTAYYELIKQLLADGVPVHGFSTQAHLGTQWGFDTSMKDNLTRFGELGIQTAITELDVRITFEGERPTDEQQQKQADYYAWSLQACLESPGCKSVTVWGFNDTYSWVPVFFQGEGAATILWEDYSAKPAYFRLLEALGVDIDPDDDDTVVEQPTVTVDKSNVAPGDSIAIEAGPFPQGTEVLATFHSDPLEIGRATVDASGRVHFTFTIPQNTPAGAHEVVVESIGGATVLRASVPLTIKATQMTPPSSDDGKTQAPSGKAPTKGATPLAKTGTVGMASIAIAAAVAAAGAVFLVARRRLA